MRTVSLARTTIAIMSRIALSACRNKCIDLEAGSGDALFAVLASSAVSLKTAEQHQMLGIGIDTIKVHFDSMMGSL